MKQYFIQALMEKALDDKKLYFLTGDLGFNVFEGCKKRLGNRFINAGVAEQNMVSVASGMAYAGLKPWVYSIAPFLILKATEQIRNDLCHTQSNVKLVGNGGGYGYGILGPSHHMLEDLAILSSMENIKMYIPTFNEDLSPIVNKMYIQTGPAYLRLGLVRTSDIKPSKYQPVRHILKGNAVSIFVLGPLLHNVLQAIKVSKKNGNADVWAVSELPFEVTAEMIKSVKKTKKIMIVEEHSKIGGIGDRLMSVLYKNNIFTDQLSHLSAHGYASHLFGSQQFHWRENQLDPDGILYHLKKFSS